MPATMTTPKTMTAVVIHSFGGPDVLRFEDRPIPEPKDNEVLVRVHAAGVNPVDWKIRQGALGQMPLPMVMGIDFSGVVERVGRAVEDVNPGDDVFGQVVADDAGSYAEYCVAPDSAIALKPTGIDHIQAAALPVAAMTAWQGLFDIADLEAGQKVLIHAAAGGVGSFAVQFAKWKSARVIGTASAQSMEIVHDLGADEVIDYHKTRFEDVVRDVDIVFDLVGGDTQERSFKVLKKNGILVSTVQPPSPEKLKQFNVRGQMMRQKPNTEDLRLIADLVARGVVQVGIESVLPLEQAREAQELSQSGHAHGKIVLQVS